MEQLAVRRAESKDIPVVAELFHALWPTGSVIEHAEELTALLADNPRQLFPDIVLVAEALGGRVVGFLEVDLRSHADGCNPSHPVGYIEGWYVVPSHRQRRIGAHSSPSQPRSGLDSKAAQRWHPTRGSIMLILRVLTKLSDSRSWTAACIIERIYEAADAVVKLPAGSLR